MCVSCHSFHFNEKKVKSRDPRISRDSGQFFPVNPGYRKASKIINPSIHLITMCQHQYLQTPLHHNRHQRYPNEHPQHLCIYIYSHPHSLLLSANIHSSYPHSTDCSTPVRVFKVHCPSCNYPILDAHCPGEMSNPQLQFTQPLPITWKTILS